jgi:multidrug resistance efflux pump
MLPRINLRVVVPTALAVAAGIAAAAPPTQPAPQPVVLAASLEPFEQVDLYARTSGYLSAVDADIGDRVSKGQVLALIDQPELDKDLAEAAAMLAAKRKLIEASDAATGQARQALEVAKHQVRRYQAETKLQAATLKRQEELFAGKAVTDQQLDDARNKAEVAQADAGVAEAKVAAAEADLKGAEAAHGVAAAQADVAAAQVAKIETMRQYLKIVAPFDGVVSRRLVTRGDLAQAAGAGRAAALFTVQRVDVLRVRCDVPEMAAGRVAVGTPAVVKLMGPAGEAVAGKVARSAGGLDPASRTMHVEIDLPNPDGRLIPGAYAQVTLTPAAEGPAATQPQPR